MNYTNLGTVAALFELGFVKEAAALDPEAARWMAELKAKQLGITPEEYLKTRGALSPTPAQRKLQSLMHQTGDVYFGDRIPTGQLEPDLVRRRTIVERGMTHLPEGSLNLESIPKRPHWGRASWEGKKPPKSPFETGRSGMRVEPSTKVMPVTPSTPQLTPVGQTGVRLPVSPFAETALATPTAAASSGGAIARLKSLLRLAPKG